MKTFVHARYCVTPFTIRVHLNGGPTGIHTYDSSLERAMKLPMGLFCSSCAPLEMLFLMESFKSKVKIFRFWPKTNNPLFRFCESKKSFEKSVPP